MSDWFVPCALFLFGCIIGSFLNVCIVRIPGEISVVFPGSHCPVCKKKIAFYDNIPLVSYLLLGAKCRNCSAPIPLHYFMVELCTPVIMLLLFYRFGMSWDLAVSFVFCSALVVITFIDLEHQIIPDVISLPGIPLAFLCSFFVPWTTPVQSLLGIAFGGGVLYAFALVYRLVTGKEGMGMGDVKLLAMIGAFLGWEGALAALLLGSFAGSVIGVFLIVWNGRDFRYAIPFGPFLSAGAFCSLLYGERLISLYLSLGGS